MIERAMTVEALRFGAWPYTRRTDLRRGLKVVVQPTVEPIDLDTARLHLRLDTEGSPATHPDDALIRDIYLPAAREACEQYLGASLTPQTIELSLSDFPICRDIELPFGPLLGVVSVTYTIDGSGTSFTDYNADTYGDRLRLTTNGSWPTADDTANAVVVRYVAGYSTPGGSPVDVLLPASIRAAILLTLSAIYDNCTQGTICDIHDLPIGCKYLLDPYRRRIGFA